MTVSFTTMAAIRFGHGLRPGEVPARNVDELLEQVRRGTAEVCPFPYGGIAGRRASFPRLRAMAEDQRQARKTGTVPKIDGKPVYPYQVALSSAFLRDQHLKLQHAVASPNGFFERLAAFWFDHFAVSASKGSTMRLLVALYEAEALRPNLGGSFEHLLKAAVLHPAMLVYLDQSRSIGPNSPAGGRTGKGLNENLARELIELHTLGAGAGYSQADVRAAACVLTGLDHSSWAFETRYRRQRAEPGVHRVLGRDYGGRERRIEDVDALLADLAAHEATARHVCRKLVVHFIADDPPEEVVETMVAAWTTSGGNLIEVYRAMLLHPRSWTEEGRKVRQPFDFVCAGLRALEVPPEALAPLPARPAKAATRVAGSGAMAMAAADDETNSPAAQATAAGQATKARGLDAPMADGRAPLRANPLSVGVLTLLGQPLWRPPSPAGWDETVSAWVTASQLTQRIGWARRLSARFGGGRDPRATLKAVLAEAARDDTIAVVARAPSRETGLALVLAAPEFNRR